MASSRRIYFESPVVLIGGDHSPEPVYAATAKMVEFLPSHSVVIVANILGPRFGELVAGIEMERAA